MPLFLQIVEGPTPATAEPIVATSDPSLIAAMGELLAQRLRDRDPATAAKVLQLSDARRSGPRP